MQRLFPLLFILLLAGWLRLGYPGVNAFAFDEARLSLIALETARGGNIATVGMPSSAGVPNMPAAAWLFALPYALSANPLIPTLAVGVVGVLAVWGVWMLARGWGAAAGITAGVFMAAHPFAVLYGRSIWAQNLLVPLAVAWLLAAYHALPNNQPRRERIAVGVGVFVSGFALQVHFAGAALALAGGYAFLRYRWWRYPLAVIVGGGLAVGAALPFILTPGAVNGLLAAAGGASTTDLAAWRDLLRLIAGYDWAYLLQGDAELPLTRLTISMVNAGLLGFLGVVVALGGLVAAGSLFPSDATAETLRLKITPTDARPLPLDLPLVLLVAAPLLFTRHSTPVFIHYLLTSLPAAALLLGWLADDARPRWLRRGMLTVVGLVALIWAGALSRGFAYAGIHHTPNGLPEPLRTLQSAAATPADELPLLFFTHGDDPLTQGEPAIFSALWWTRRDTTRIVDGQSVLILPPEPSTLMFTERAFQAWEVACWVGVLDDRITLPRRLGIAPFEMARYNGEPPQGFTRLAAPATFTHGGSLLGWRVDVIGARTRVSTLWEAAGALPVDIQGFHHLRRAGTLDSEPLMISDGSVRGHLWRAGDRVIVMADFFDVDISGEYVVDVGHYRLSDLTRIPHNDGGDSLRLGAFRPMPTALDCDG